MSAGVQRMAEGNSTSQRDRDTQTQAPTTHKERWTEKQGMPEAETETQKALYPVALMPLSKGAQVYQTGFVPILSSRPHWPHCSMKETIQPYFPPAFHGTLSESTQRLKFLWATGLSFQIWKWEFMVWISGGQGSGSLHLGFARWKTHDVAGGGHSAKQRHHVAHWSPGSHWGGSVGSGRWVGPGEGGGGGPEVTPLGLRAGPWSVTPTTLSANGWDWAQQPGSGSQLQQPSSIQVSSVAQLCSTLCDPMNHSTPGLPVQHQHPEFTQTHIHWISDSIKPSHPLSSPSPPAPNPSQHQSPFQWVNSSHEVAKVLEFQLYHHSFQRNPRADLLQNGLVGYPCSPRDSQESSPTPQFKSINSFVLSFLHSPTLTSIHDHRKNHRLD